MLSRTNPRLMISLLCLLVLLSFVIAINTGAVAMNSHEIWQSLFGHATTLHQEIIVRIRLPRILNAFTTGALLALAGSLMQVILRNPLADPYILGVSGGAATLTLLGILLGFSGVYLHGLTLFGALVSMLLVFVFARGRGSWSPVRLLLTGVILSSGWAACITLIMSISPDRLLPSMLFWLMGDIHYDTSCYPGMIVLMSGIILSLIFSRQLNILSLGETRALSLGENTQQLRIMIYFISAILTAFAVNMAGCIGFVGLVVPHIVRLLIGNDQRILLPIAALMGGLLLVVADTLARSIIGNTELPVGVITALIGVPTFLILLAKEYRQWQ